jgi:hypothetical protein
VLRIEAKKVLMFNHEPFEDFMDYTPAFGLGSRWYHFGDEGVDRFRGSHRGAETPSGRARARSRLDGRHLSLRGRKVAAKLPDKLAVLGISGGAVYDALVGLVAAEHDVQLATRDARARGTYEAVGARVVIAG